MPCRVASVLIVLLATLASATPAAAERILPPGGEASFGEARVDVNAAGRVAVAYERIRRGPDAIRVSVRSAARLGTPAEGRLVGRGALRLVRLGDRPADPHVVVWRRGGQLVASVWRRGAWRAESLPAAVRRGDALDGAVTRGRVVLVVGGSRDAVAVVRGPSGRWRAHPLPVGGAPRSGLVAAVARGSGRVVVAWTAGGTGPGAAVWAAHLAPETAVWTTPVPLMAGGTIAAPIVGDLSLNARGDAVASVNTSPRFSGPASRTVPIRFLPYDADAWTSLPDLGTGRQVAVTPAGVPVAAWLATTQLLFAAYDPASESWGPPEVAWDRPDDDFGYLYGAGDLAVDADGRVVVVAGVDPGPGPDDHFFVVRPAGGPPWSRPDRFASLYGSPALQVGGSLVIASWLEDPSGSGLPEAALAP